MSLDPEVNELLEDTIPDILERLEAIEELLSIVMVDDTLYEVNEVEVEENNGVLEYCIPTD